VYGFAGDIEARVPERDRPIGIDLLDRFDGQNRLVQHVNTELGCTSLVNALVRYSLVGGPGDIPRAAAREGRSDAAAAAMISWIRVP
jgi:hypothetical protein